MKVLKTLLLIAVVRYTWQVSEWMEPHSYPFYHLAPFKSACRTDEVVTLPILLFAGCNDWCPGIDYFEESIQKHTNSRVICVEYAPKIDSVFNNLEKMIEKACNKIEEYRGILTDGYILIGMSMGGLIARGILQICDIGQYATKLITLGTPHMGITTVPSFEKNWMIDLFNKIFKTFAYSNVFQGFVGSTNFFKIPEKYTEFLQSRTYLSILNNEGLYNDSFRQRTIRLKQFVLVSYKGENFLEPKESVSFGWFDDKDLSKIVRFNQTKLYKQDLIGLRYLDENGRLSFVEVPGRHQDPRIAFTDEFKKIVYHCF
jgi:palmitoyl-protein thioesterase